MFLQIILDHTSKKDQGYMDAVNDEVWSNMNKHVMSQKSYLYMVMFQRFLCLNKQLF